MPEHRPDEKTDGKPLQAAALGYDRGTENAPRVLARGGGDVAHNILERAAEHGIPVQRDPDLLECLAPLTIGEEIPLEAYTAVAHILAFLYQENRGG